MSTSINRQEDAYDVIVIGSGAAGMAAAITAKQEGLSVLLLEKTDKIGGSTAISGGAIWAPMNDQTEKVGHPDSFEKAWTYLQETVGNAGAEDVRRSFLEKSPEALRYLEKHAGLRLAGRTYSPDYYSDRAGAAMGGRSLDPMEFDGRLLNDAFKELRNPLKEFTVLGGMMVNLTDVRHLLAVTRSFASWKHGMKLVLRYAADRLRGFHRGTRLLLGNALAGQLFHSVLQQKISYRLRVDVAALLRDDAADANRVTGVQIREQGNTINVRARRGVVVATGGFPWNTHMRAQLYPQPTGPYSMSPQDNQGEGIQLAISAGASMGQGHAHPAFWAPVSMRQCADGTVQRYPHLVWERAKPGLMAVNAAGQRFVNESTSYHEFVIGMYRAHQTSSSIPAFLVCDSAFIEKWGLGLALPGGRKRDHLVQDGYLYKADTLEALGKQVGIDGTALAASALRFNSFAVTGSDAEFGKGSTAYNRYLGDAAHKPNECLGTLQQGPFYAVKVYPGDIGTACGIRADGDARALNAEGQVIPGLYVAGNDMHSVMGGQYPGPGITLGPALTFGWLAAMHLARGR